MRDYDAAASNPFLTSTERRLKDLEDRLQHDDDRMAALEARVAELEAMFTPAPIHGEYPGMDEAMRKAGLL